MTDLTDLPVPHPGPDIPVITIVGPKFTLGRLVATAGVMETEAPTDIATAIERHARGDWSDVDDDKTTQAVRQAENNSALEDGYRLMSVYTFPTTGNVVWVITEPDRSVTTVLYPSEY
jgi:hypothetical protein